jgi:acetylornithine deacetylase/succinyl-diaminopimelate desuccinylase-like protein
VDQRSIDVATGSIEADLVALRRDIHEHPEVAGEERRTAALVADRLRAAGLAVTTGVGGHGVVGMLHGARKGRTVAYRADMDAVQAGQTTGGVTDTGHLCGHDLHTTVGVGVAEVLAGLRSRLSGSVAFVFQPAEENLTGAQAMLDDGVLRRTDAREIHALHCGPMPVGTLAVTPGFGMPGLDRGTVTLTGPDAAARAEALAADIVDLATVRRPQTLDDMEQLLVDLGTPDGPLARFVNIQHATPRPGRNGSVTVATSYRCWPEVRHLEVRDNIRAIAVRYGADAEFPGAPFPALPGTGRHPAGTPSAPFTRTRAGVADAGRTAVQRRGLRAVRSADPRHVHLPGRTVAWRARHHGLSAPCGLRAGRARHRHGSTCDGGLARRARAAYVNRPLRKGRSGSPCA